MNENKVNQYVEEINRSINAMTPDELEDVAIVTSALEFSSSSPVVKNLFKNIKSYTTEKLLDKRISLAQTLKNMPKNVLKKHKIKKEKEMVR